MTLHHEVNPVSDNCKEMLLMGRIAEQNYMAPGCLHLLFLFAAVFLNYNLQILISWREKRLVLGQKKKKKMSPPPLLPSPPAISLDNSYYS